ncbi:MAG: ABC transporter ATP-binding protein [Anaerolineae bacterium]
MNTPVVGSRITAWSEIRRLLRPWRVHIAVIAVSILVFEALAVIPSLLMQRIVDEHLLLGLADGILPLALFYLAATVLAETMHFGITYLTAWVAQRALRALRVDLFAHLLRLPLAYYDRTPLGDAISRCTADVETVDTLFSTGVSSLLLRLVQLVVAFVAMLSLSPRLALLALLLLPPLALATRFFQIHIRDAERERRKAIGLLNVYLQETLAGVEVVRAFGREETLLTRFRRALRDTLAAFWRAESYNMYYTPSLTVLVALCVALLLWSGTGGLGQAWGLSMGVIIAFILLFQRFFDPVRNLGEDWQTVQSALSGIERIVQVLQIPAEASLEEIGMASPDRGEAVELRGVTFGYLDGHPVLREISLSVRAGEHVALVGRTGAGKSSLVHLLGGLYTPWTGEVRVAGLDPRALSDTQRRRVVGVVPQMVQLFAGSVWDNLTLDDPTASPVAVERAVQMTGLERLVAVLPQGYATPLSGVGRGQGVQLSEGQQQLLSLARALVWDPAVLLLDEATASVDNASESDFRAALRAAIRGADGRQRAALTVAHRLSTAREADRVIVLDDGRIVEQGTPEALIQQGGRFAALVELEEAGWDWQVGI